MSTNVKRRTFVMGAGAVAAGAAITACSTPGETDDDASAGGDATSEAPVDTIVFLTNADDVTAQETVDAYNATDPGFTVELRQTDAATYGENFPRLATASDAPNLAGYFIDGGRYVDMALAGTLADLTDLWESSGMNEAVPDLIRERYLALTDDGAVYGIPTNTSRYGIMFFRPSILEGAGVTLPTDHEWESEEEFNAACEALIAAGIDAISVGGQAGYPLSHVQDGLLSSVMEPDLVSDPLAIDYLSDEWRAPVAKMLEWVTKGYWSRGFLGRDTDTGNTLVAQGKVGFSTGMNVWQPLLEEAGVPTEDLDWCLLPPIGSLQPKLSVYAGGGLVIPSRAGGRAEAFEYATWLVSPERALVGAQEAQYIPARGDVEGLEEALGPIGGSMFTVSAKDGYSQFGWDDPAPTDMITYDRDNLQAVLAGTLTIDDFCSELERLKEGNLE